MWVIHPRNHRRVKLLPISSDDLKKFHTWKYEAAYKVQYSEGHLGDLVSVCLHQVSSGLKFRPITKIGCVFYGINENNP
jgi:hypothetical protein